MNAVTIDDIEADVIGDDSQRRRLTDALGAANVAINHYRLAAGEGLPGGLHAHADQEELFVVSAGTVTFETVDPETRRGRVVTVESGEAIRFPPGEFQSGYNDGQRTAVVLACGAPPDSTDLRLPFECQACEQDQLRLDTETGPPEFVCPACGERIRPAPCPECGCEDLRGTLDDKQDVVAACQHCSAVFDRPPQMED